MQTFVVHVPKLIAYAKLNPVAYNPRTITAEKFGALKKNIVTEGFVESMIVQKRGLKIIGGHQKYKAVGEICVESKCAPPDLPCIVLDIDDRRAKKLNIKMNRLRGEFDPRKLGELLVDIFDQEPITEIEANDLGWPLNEVQKYVEIIEPSDVHTPGTEPKTFGNSITLSIEFATVEHRDQVKKMLKVRAEVEKKKTGEIIAYLLKGRPKVPKKVKRAPKS